jgi:hypothetical protein
MRRIGLIAAILLTVTLATAESQGSNTSTIGNLPSNQSPSPYAFTIVDDGTSHTWKTTLQDFVDSVLSASPLPAAYGGLGLAATNSIPTASCLGFSGTAWTTPRCGTLTSLATANGISGGPISTAGTLSLASIANGDVLANISGSAGVPSPNPMSSVLDSVFGDTVGSMLYRGSSSWQVLAPGSTGQILGYSGGPTWTSVPQATPSPIASNGIAITGSSPYDIAMSGSYTGNFGVSGSVVAGSASAPTVSAGDLAASENTGQGALWLGGSVESCKFDYQVEHLSAATLGCSLVIGNSGNLTVTGESTVDGAISSESFIQAGPPTDGLETLAAGDINSADSTSTGRLYLGGTTSDCALDYGITTAGKASFSCAVNLPDGISTDGITNTALASSTAKPLCGSNSSAEAQCTLTPLFNSSGNVSKATSTTANSYVTLGSASVTTGVSGGPNGEWLLDIKMPLNVGGASSEYAYGCITSSSTGTVEDSTTAFSQTCITSVTGSIAGNVEFGDSTGSDVGLQSFVEAHVLVANSTTYAVTGLVSASTTTPLTVYGNVNITATPY